MPKIIDQYVLEARIGKGQFGEVYRGVHQKTGQIVAVKAIQRGMIKGTRQIMEANSTSCLRMRSKF